MSALVRYRPFAWLIRNPLLRPAASRERRTDPRDTGEDGVKWMEVKVKTDAEVLLAAVEEAQRLLAAYESPHCRDTRDDVIAMVEFILCDPSVTRAMLRQKMRTRLMLVG